MTAGRTPVAIFIALALAGVITACGDNEPGPDSHPSTSNPTSSGDNTVAPPGTGYCTDILEASEIEDVLRDRTWSVLSETVVSGGVSCTINGATRPENSNDVSVPTILSFRLTMRHIADGPDPAAIEDEYEERLKWLTAASASDQMFVGGTKRSAIQGWWSEGDRFASLESSGSSSNLFVESLVVGNGAYVNVATRCTTGKKSGKSVNQVLLAASDALLASIPQI